MTQEQRIVQREQEKRLLLLLHPVLEGKADGCSGAQP